MSDAQANASMHTVLSGMLSRLRSPNRRTPRVVMTGRNAASFLSKVGLDCPPNVPLFRHVDSSRPIGHVPLNRAVKYFGKVKSDILTAASLYR